MPKLKVSRADVAGLVSDDGVVTDVALRSAGITRAVQARLVRDGMLVQFAPGVLGLAPASWRSYLGAALRIAGPDGAAFGATALALYGVGEQVFPVQVLVPKRAQRRNRDWVCFYRSDAPRRIVRQHPFARVAFDDSVIDTLDSLDEIGAIALLTRVLQERRTTADRLLGIVESRPRVAHRVVATRILRDGAGLESALEYVYAERVERAHGLEPMTRQYVVPETGHRADGAYIERRRLIHLDGAKYHDRDVDRELDNTHGGFDYTSLRFGWADCWSRPCATAQRVAGSPVPRRCRRCR